MTSVTRTPDRITAQLAVGCEKAARDLPSDHDFDRVITLGWWAGPGHSCPPLSTDAHVFPDGPHNYDSFREAVETVIDALEAGDDIFVHCQAGISRSPTVSATALATLEDTTFGEQLTRIQEERPIVSPGPELRESAMLYLDELWF